jgi:hypothetical protein
MLTVPSQFNCCILVHRGHSRNILGVKTTSSVTIIGFASELGLYEGYPESNFRFHVEHEVVGAARRGCTAV